MRVSWNPIQFGPWGIDMHYHQSTLPKASWNSPQPSAEQSAHIVPELDDAIDRWTHGVSLHQPPLWRCKIAPSRWFTAHNP